MVNPGVSLNKSNAISMIDPADKLNNMNAPAVQLVESHLLTDAEVSAYIWNNSIPDENDENDDLLTEKVLKKTVPN